MTRIKSRLRAATAYKFVFKHGEDAEAFIEGQPGFKKD